MYRIYFPLQLPDLLEVLQFISCGQTKFRVLSLTGLANLFGSEKLAVMLTLMIKC